MEFSIGIMLGTEDELKDGLGLHGIRVVDLWSTGDQLKRDGFYWINLVGIKE